MATRARRGQPFTEASLPTIFDTNLSRAMSNWNYLAHNANTETGRQFWAAKVVKAYEGRNSNE